MDVSAGSANSFAQVITPGFVRRGADTGVCVSSAPSLCCHPRVPRTAHTLLPCLARRTLQLVSDWFTPTQQRESTDENETTVADAYLFHPHPLHIFRRSVIASGLVIDPTSVSIELRSLARPPHHSSVAW